MLNASKSALRSFSWLVISSMVLIALSPFGQGGESIPASFLIETAIAAMVGLWLLFTAKGRHRFRTAGLAGPLVGFLAICLLSYHVSDYRYSSQIELVRIVLFTALLFALVGGADLKGLGALLRWVVLVGAFESVFCLVQFYLLSAPRAKGTFFSPNLAATFLLGCCAISVALSVWSTERFSVKLLWAASGGLAVWAIVTTGSRSGLLTLAVILGVVLALGRMRKGWLLTGAMLLVLILIVPNPIRERVFFSRSDDIYAVQRPKIWVQSAKMILDQPLLGATLGNFEYASSRYQFPVNEAVGRYAKVFSTADNGILEIAAETGIPGVMCLAWGAAVLLRLYRKGKVVVKGSVDEPYFLAASLVLVALTSQAFFHKVYGSPPSVLMGIVALSIVALVGGPEAGMSNYWQRWSSAWGEQRGLLGKRARATFVVGGLVILFVAAWPFLCLAPYLAFRHYEKATLFQASGDLKSAYDELRKAISYNPGQAFYHHRLGNLAMERFSVERAEETARAALDAFNRAIDLNKVHSPFWITRARYHEFMVPFSEGRGREDHIRQAAASYERAIQLSPTNPFYRVRLAALHIKGGGLEQARRPLQEALDLEPNFVTAQALLIDVSEKLGSKEQARRLRGELERTVLRLSKYRPMNGYEAKLLMDPARYFKEEEGGG